MRYFWQGEWIGDEAVTQRLHTLEDRTQQVVSGPRLNPLVVLAAAEALVPRLEEHRAELVACGLDALEADDTLAALRHALRRPELERKLRRELGDLDPARLVRFDLRMPTYEAWVPLGLLAHVTSGSTSATGVLSAVEGLLSGNLNVVVPEDSGFTAGVLAALAAHDPSGQIAARLVVLSTSSSRTGWMAAVLGAADAVAVWGDEETIAEVSASVRPGTRVVDWGPKLSFAYLTRDRWSDVDTLHALAADVSQLEQQSPSSPQVIYLDTEDARQVFAFAERFASVLELTAPATREPSQAEWAEITNTVVVTELEEHLGYTKVHHGPHWRVLADVRFAPRTSPLHRTVWVKPLPRKQITSVLRPMRRYLQTVGLGAGRPDTAVLARAFVSVGVHRITTPGSMLGGYGGEPHDGVYALQRYSNRVSVRLDDRFTGHAVLDDLAEPRRLPPDADPVPADVYFRGGGFPRPPERTAASGAGRTPAPARPGA